MHRYRSGRMYRYRSWYRQMLLGGSMQRAARAMHCIALSQIQCPQWECLRSTQRVEIGPQWELSVYLLRLPRYRLTTPQSDCVTRGVSDQNTIHS